MATNNNQIFLKISIDGKNSISVIRELESQLKAARKELQDLNLQGEQKSKTEISIKNLSTELEKLKSNGGGTGLSALRKEAQLLDLQLGTLTKGTAAWAAKFSELGAKKKEINDLGKELKLLDPENRIKAMIGAGAALTASFTAVQGIMHLVGEENKSVEEGLKNVAAGIEVLASVSEIAKQKENIGLLLRIAGYKSLTASVGQAAGAQGALSTSTNVAAGSFSKLKAALISTGIGALVVGVGLLITNYDKLKESITGVSKVQNQINNLRVDAGKAAAEEQSKVSALVTEYKTVNTSTLRRKEIIDELQKISPNYFGTLNKEKTTVEQLTGAYDRWSKAVLLKAQTDALTKSISENNIKIAEIQNGQITDQISIWQTLGNAVLSFGNVGAFATKQVESGLESQKEKTQELADTNKVLQKELEKTYTALNLAGGNTSGDPNKANEEANKSAQERLNNKLKLIEQEKKVNIDAGEAEYQSVVSAQNRIEEEARLSFERQKSDLAKFTEEKRALLLNQELNVQTDTSLSKDDRAVKLKAIHDQLLKLDSDYQKGVLQLETEGLNSLKELNNKNEQEQLSAKQKQLTDGLKLIEDAKQKELKLINSSPVDNGEKTKQRNAVILQAEKDAAELRKKINADTNKTIEDGAKKRSDNEVAIINNTTESYKQANDALKELVKQTSDFVAEYNSTLKDSSFELADGLVNLYNSIADSIRQKFEDNAQLEKDAIDASLNSQTEKLITYKETQLNNLQQEFDNGLISKELYEQRKTDIEKNYQNQSAKAKEESEKKKEQVDKKVGEQKKKFEKINIGIELAKTVANIGFKIAELNAAAAINPLLLTLIPLVAAQIPLAIGAAGVQYVTIDSKKFATGGIIKSNSENGNSSDGRALVNHSQNRYIYINNKTKVKDLVQYEKIYKSGGQITQGTTGTADDVPILASKGEVIINAKSAALFRKQLSDINSYNGYGLKFATGGIIGNMTSTDGRALVNNSQLRVSSDSSKVEELLEKLIDQNDALIERAEATVAVSAQIRDTEYKARVVSSEVTKQQSIDKITESRSYFS